MSRLITVIFVSPIITPLCPGFLWEGPSLTSFHWERDVTKRLTVFVDISIKGNNQYSFTCVVNNYAHFTSSFFVTGWYCEYNPIRKPNKTLISPKWFTTKQKSKQLFHIPNCSPTSFSQICIFLPLPILVCNSDLKSRQWVLWLSQYWSSPNQSDKLNSPSMVYYTSSSPTISCQPGILLISQSFLNN